MPDYRLSFTPEIDAELELARTKGHNHIVVMLHAQNLHDVSLRSYPREADMYADLATRKDNTLLVIETFNLGTKSNAEVANALHGHTVHSCAAPSVSEGLGI